MMLKYKGNPYFTSMKNYVYDMSSIIIEYDMNALGKHVYKLS